MQGTLKKSKIKMETKQSMAQAKIQAVIEVTKAAIMAAKEADNPVNNARPIHTKLRSGPTTKTTYV